VREREVGCAWGEGDQVEKRVWEKKKKTLRWMCWERSASWREGEMKRGQTLGSLNKLKREGGGWDHQMSCRG
jgi:hypothetical protein